MHHLCSLILSRAYGLPIDVVDRFLDKFPDRYYYSRDGVALFLRLSDENFKKLVDGEFDICDGRVLHELLKDEGENIHVFSLVSKGVSSIRRLVRCVRYKSLSWYTEDLSRLVVFRRR